VGSTTPVDWPRDPLPALPRQGGHRRANHKHISTAVATNFSRIKAPDRSPSQARPKTRETDMGDPIAP
jgi:hypothetical protein